MKKKLVLMTSALMAIGLLAGCGSKHTHEYKLVDEVAATCTESGVHAHYTCEGCDKLFDEDKKETTLEALTIAALGHNLTAHESHAETCTEAGNCAYWSCERCGKFFSDEEGKDELKKDGWIIPAHAHTLIHNDAKAATCYVPGNIEYWVCTECFQYFSDEACFSDEEGKNEIDAESIIIPALGTDKSYFNGTVWHHGSPGSGYYLYLNYGYFNAYELEYNYYFDDFDYNDTTKELSFIVTKVQKFSSNPSPYGVGDTISFTYNAEKDVLMFGTIELSK